MRVPQFSIPRMLGQLTADSAALTGTDTAFLVTASGLILPGTLAVGSRFFFMGRYNSSLGTSAPNIKCHVGNLGTTGDGLLFSVNGNAAAGDQTFVGSFVVRTLGTTGTLRAMGWDHPTAAPGGAQMDTQAEPTINTVANELRITLSGSVATGNLVIRDAFIQQIA